MSFPFLKQRLLTQLSDRLFQEETEIALKVDASMQIVRYLLKDLELKQRVDSQFLFQDRLLWKKWKKSSVETLPKYWFDRSKGLKVAVNRYFKTDPAPLTAADLDCLKEYISDRLAQDGRQLAELSRPIDSLKTRRDISAIAKQCSLANIDLF